MAYEVKCPYNDGVVLQSIAEHDSTFNILTPFPFSKMEDYSYAVAETLKPVNAPVMIDHYDDNGNLLYTEYDRNEDGSIKYESTKTLSAVGYEFHFPHKLDEAESVQNNSIGWFNSWGVASGAINYSFGKNWTFGVANVGDDISKTSGRCGLNDESEICYLSATKEFVARNNNALFDYLLQGQNHKYLKLSKLGTAADTLVPAEETKNADYYLSIDSVEDLDYYKALYTDDENKKTALTNAMAIGETKLSKYPAINTNTIYYTPTELEADFGFDMNEPSSYKNVAWHIYGVYWYEGQRKYMELNDGLQNRFNTMMKSQQLKMNYTSFRQLITYVTHLASDIIYNNIEYANVVLATLNNKGEETDRFVVADSMLLKIGENTIPELKKNDQITISTPNAESKPEFLMNDIFLIDFPCYRFFGDTLQSITKRNFVYDANTNTTRFELVVNGLAPQDLSISNTLKTDWRLIGKKTKFLIPPVYDSFNPYKNVVDVTDSAFGTYPVHQPTGKQLYLSPLNNYIMEGTSCKTWGNLDGKLTMNSKYPMTPKGAVRFVTSTIFTIEVEADVVSHTFTISSPSINQSVQTKVQYNRLYSASTVTKLSNTIERVINGVNLQPYMYDGTTIKCGYKLSGGQEIELKNEDVTITISDNTGSGKNYIGVKLTDIVNGEFNDLIFSSGLVKNELEGVYELTIYMAATCTDDKFNGMGFNDSTVLLVFNIDEKYKQIYNLQEDAYNINYITTLPPYLVEGIPFTKTPEEEAVLNSAIAPENSAARVDYNSYTYPDNAYGYVSDSLFTNGVPMYYSIASALIPNNFAGTISGVDCKLVDNWTGKVSPIPFTSATAGTLEYLVLTSGDGSGYVADTQTYSGTAELKLWTFEQKLDVSATRINKGITSNMLQISAHLDYSTIDETLETENMVIIRSNS